MSIKIGINGFGRIGRMVLRAALKHPDVEVVAINDLTDSETMAYLLKYDSVHGQLNMDVSAHKDSIEIDGKSVTIRSVKDPEKIGWSDLGVDIAAECTGIFRDREGASKHQYYLQCFLHNQLPGTGSQSPAGKFWIKQRIDDHDPFLYRRPAPAGLSP